MAIADRGRARVETRSSSRCCSSLTATPAGAEKLVSTVSSSTVQITSSFDGAVLSLFGTIEPDVRRDAR